MEIDDPATTERRREIITSKPFLRSIYDEWYSLLAQELPAGDGDVLELGSGGGYCEQFIKGLITSEVFPTPFAQLVLEARNIPFEPGSLRAIVFTDVLHHMPDVSQFFAEAVRCLRPGGRILMVEPWVTPWSRFVYTHFHHEPFLPDAPDWSFPVSGPLSGANGALPWIVFVRDRAKFGFRFPELQIQCIRPFLPFRYLVSGGVGMRNLMPGFTHSFWACLERILESQMFRLAMFAFISIQRR